MESDKQQREGISAHTTAAAVLALALASPVPLALAQATQLEEPGLPGMMGTTDESGRAGRAGYGAQMTRTPGGQAAPVLRGARSMEDPAWPAAQDEATDQTGPEFDLPEDRKALAPPAPVEKSRTRKTRRAGRGSEFPGVIRFP